MASAHNLLFFKTMTAAVMLIAAFVTPPSAGAASDASVDIVNHMGQGDPIQVHCKSRDNDLGLQTLVPNETWGFGFKINFFGSTLFTCTFDVSSTTGAQQSASFETFGDDVRTRVPCVHCVWTVRPEGFYVNIQGNPGVGTFFHPWGTHTAPWACQLKKPDRDETRLMAEIDSGGDASDTSVLSTATASFAALEIPGSIGNYCNI